MFQVLGRGGHERLPWLPFYLHFTHNHLVIACIADNWHLPSIWTVKVHFHTLWGNNRGGHDEERWALAIFHYFAVLFDLKSAWGKTALLMSKLTSPLSKRREAPLFRGEKWGSNSCRSSPILAILRFSGAIVTLFFQAITSYTYYDKYIFVDCSLAIAPARLTMESSWSPPLPRQVSCVALASSSLAILSARSSIK